ncbi:MAG: hypothetical protein RI946_392, partial [Pseudomonadota bacterium]
NMFRRENDFCGFGPRGPVSAAELAMLFRPSEF